MLRLSLGEGKANSDKPPNQSAGEALATAAPTLTPSPKEKQQQFGFWFSSLRKLQGKTTTQQNVITIPENIHTCLLQK